MTPASPRDGRIALGHALRRHRWKLLAICGLGALGLGLAGYGELYPNLPFLDRLYATFALFRAATTLYGNSQPPLPWALEVARWIAPTVLVLAGLSALLALLVEPLVRTRIRYAFRGHLVVCGLGHFGLRLALNARAEGTRVVVIDCAPLSLAVSHCRAHGIPVLVADATDAEVLRAAGVERATRLVAVCGDNGVNHEVALAARGALDSARSVLGGPAPRSAAARRNRRLDCFVQIDDDVLCQRLEQASLLASDKRRVSISYVNVFRSGSTALLHAYPGAFALRDGQSPHLVVAGGDALGELLVVGAVREWWFDHRVDGRRLELTLLGRDASERAAKLRRHFPRFEQACVLRVVDDDPSEPGSASMGSLEAGDAWTRTTVFVSYGEDRRTLEATMRLARELPRHVPIVALSGGHAGPVTLVDAVAHDLRLSNVSAFPVLDRICRPEVFLNSLVEQVAQALHENYLENRHRDRTFDPALSSHRPWIELDQRFRESNREAAIGRCRRLEQAGFRLEVTDEWAVELPTLSDEQIASMAVLEHDRWSRQQRRQGAAGAAHPDLIAWEQLSDAEKDKDRAAVRELPGLLARYGLAAIPIGPQSGDPPE